MKTQHIIVIFLLWIGIISACKKDTVNPANPSSAAVLITDSPASYQEVNLDIQHIELKYESADTNREAGWIDLNTKAGIYDMLKFRNSVYTLLGNKDDL